MKFDKRFYFSTIPEWKDQYLDYAGLCAQIKLIKKAALNLAKAYANIKGSYLPVITNTTLTCRKILCNGLPPFCHS
jgi:hypothetical protein